MGVRGVRILAAVFLLLFLVAVTWPGMVPFNRIRPFVLGLPFSMAWVALWVVLGCLVLWLVDVVERSAGKPRSPRRPGTPRGGRR
ncbi:MAG TPA: DUF3311 domain-containing protein [Longimicrobiales bacterium]|nr:DUF3311 domain-containing protein [Longimicrobiales bacterium]